MGHNPIGCPDIRLNSDRCGLGCCVVADETQLSNFPEDQPPQHIATSTTFPFCGTCGREALSGRQYFQVDTFAKLLNDGDQISEQITVCEFGIASQAALSKAHKTINPSEEFALTVKFRVSGGKFCVRICFGDQELLEQPIGIGDGPKRFGTIGFLLDTNTGQVLIFDNGNDNPLLDITLLQIENVYPVFNLVQPIETSRVLVLMEVYDFTCLL